MGGEAHSCRGQHPPHQAFMGKYSAMPGSRTPTTSAAVAAAAGETSTSSAMLREAMVAEWWSRGMHRTMERRLKKPKQLRRRGRAKGAVSWRAKAGLPLP